MIKIFLLFCCSSLMVGAKAQPDPLRDFNKHVVENWSGDYIRIGPYRVKGSPFFLGESFPGVIKYKGGKTVTDIKVLYNLYNQKAGVDVNHDIFEANDAVAEFQVQLPSKFGGQTLLFKNTNQYQKESAEEFLNVLAEGSKAAFFKQYKTKLQADPTNTLSKDDKVFEQYYEYYLYTMASPGLHKIKLRSKDVLKELGEDPQIKEYVLKNHMDLSKEEDVIQLINKYNNSFN